MCEITDTDRQIELTSCFQSLDTAGCQRCLQWVECSLHVLCPQYQINWVWSYSPVVPAVEGGDRGLGFKVIVSYKVSWGQPS